MVEKRIFTFWENKNGMPDYIKMCIESWEKYLPEYEIIILNYSNLSDWIGENFYDKYYFENFTIAEQSYGIRAAVLYKHGGIWFDADTIITSEKAKDILNVDTELAMFGNMPRVFVAKKGSKILKKWINGIKFNILKFKILFPFYFRYYPYKAMDMLNWHYFSADILRRPLKTKNKKLFISLECEKSKVLAENSWYNEQPIKNFKDIPTTLYTHFYINNNFADYALKDNCGILCLHNSWISNKHKKMSREEILKENNTFGEIFRRVL